MHMQFLIHHISHAHTFSSHTHTFFLSLSLSLTHTEELVAVSQADIVDPGTMVMLLQAAGRYFATLSLTHTYIYIYANHSTHTNR
jgi:predicted component of viral defense system (DUF524 family)